MTDRPTDADLARWEALAAQATNPINPLSPRWDTEDR